MKHRRLKTIISVFSLWMLLTVGITGCSDLTSDATAQRTAPQNQVSEGEDVLNVYFLDIGQGDCIAITQGDHAMLIDAGDNDKGTAVQSYLNYLGIEALDYCILKANPDGERK